MATNRLVTKEKIAVYAKTMFAAAREAGGQDSAVEVRNQLKQLCSLIYADMELSGALMGIEYAPQVRADLARAVFADCNPALREVMAVMAENRDIDLITGVYHAYEDNLKADMNIAVVDVVTVVPLDDELRKLIEKKAETDLGVNAVLNESIDASILGGIIMSVNGKRIDASMISQLNRARHTLKDTDGGES